MSTERLPKSGKNHGNIHFILFILTYIAILSVGCEEKPDILGLDILPDSIRAYCDTSEVVYAFTMETDSVVSNIKSGFLLGSHVDTIFGQTTASIITEFDLIEYGSYSFGTNPMPDSVFIRLDFTGFKGDLMGDMEFFVYEFEEELRTDTNIYSNMDIEGRFNPAVLGSGEINASDSIVKISIEDTDFINKLLMAPDSVYKNNDYLQSYINGLYFVPVLQSGEGAMLDLTLSSYPGVLGIYYRNEEEDSLDYFLEVGGPASKKYNLFTYNFEGTPLAESLNNGTGPDSNVYIGSPGLVNAIIRFPELSFWIDSMPIAINHAQLIITPVDSLSSGIGIRDYPASLDLLRYGEDGVNRFIYDYMLNQTTFGGSYDEETNSYSFNLKVHIQSYLDGNLENLDLILLPGSNAETYKQLIVYGGNSRHPGKMRLEIVYTKL